MRPHQPLELAEVRRERGDLAAEHEPAQALVGRVPRVREDRDLALVHGRAGVGEEVGGRALPGRRRAARSGRRGCGSAARATTAHRRAAGDGGRRAPGCARAAARSGGRCPRSGARSSPGRSSAPRARAPCARSARAASGSASSSATASASVSTPKLSTSTPVSPGTTTPPPVREPDATTGTPDAAASITGRPSSGPCDGATTTSLAWYRFAVSCVNGTKRKSSRQPELVDELLRLGLVVPRQVGELQRPADERAEELLAAHRAADDQVARVEPAVAQPRRGLDELAEALRRVDEAEVGDDRAVRRQAERGLRLRAGRRAGSGRGRRSSGRPSSRRRRRSATSCVIAIDVVASFRIAARTKAERAVLAAVRQRRAQVPDDGQVLAAREPGRRDQRRVVEVDELELVAPQRPAEAQDVAAEAARARARTAASGGRGTSTPRCA